jgi:PleD family two-component response regulator
LKFEIKADLVQAFTLYVLRLLKHFCKTQEVTMSKARLLIVEDDTDIANMLRIFFTGQGYDVDIALRGSEALEKTRQNLPHLIILDIMLPDIDGFEVCRVLRTNTRTSHVPIIFLTQKDERSDKLQGLELGADDYITKPFDIEELKLRVQRAIERAEQQSLTDPHSGLPSGRLIEEQLRKIIRLDKWALLDIRINHYNAFNEVYGFVAADDILRFTAMLMSEVVDHYGTTDDFIGHAGGDNFIVITHEESAEAIKHNFKLRFAEEVLSHYNFLDREQGYIWSSEESGDSVQTPLMTLAIGIVSPSKYQFADIREITEMAAEARRDDTG